MSIKDRINRMREDSNNWRNRVSVEILTPDADAIPSVGQIRQSLAASQESWRKRVENRDAANFTVAGRVGRYHQKPQRSLTIHTSYPPSNVSPECNPCPLNLEDAINFPHRPAALPIVRMTSKENQPTPKLFRAEQKTTEVTTTGSVPPTETVKQTVAVPALQEDALVDFFKSEPLLETNQLDNLQFPANNTPTVDRTPANYQRIVEARRAARPERRKPSRTPNPLKSLAQRTDLRTEYEEVRCSSAILQSQTSTPYQHLLHPIDPASRLSNEAAMRRSMLANSVLVGLSSRENFSDAKSNLRQVTENQLSPLSVSQRQLLPYKPTMLLQVKGRRHVQVRLVCPSADSMNSGDCFVLVTSEAVFAWLGEFANVVEINKARELASWIHSHHELGYRSADSDTTDYITVQQQTVDVPDEHTTEETDDTVDPVDSPAARFWKALGYEDSQSVQACGTNDEDELYEVLIQHTNRVYQVTVDQLVPCMQYWGSPMRHRLLRTDQAYVFDFGSEVYLWTGTQISPEIRLAGIELVHQAYSAPYDYNNCRLNPLDPLSTHSDIPLRAVSRPSWTLVCKVTEKGETVLFKEKFSDWPDFSRLGVRLTPHSRLQRNKLTTSVYAQIQPYSADELYETAFNEPPPLPTLLTLEGRFVGRGGEGCRYEDGIMRRYRVESGSLRVWHVSEFSRTEIPEASHGQFHQGDTYVIRWPFKVLHVGLRDVPTRNPELLQEQCTYFFWQGSQSKVTEQGAAALMTIELDEERGPQLRVTEGKEPPAFCRLFNGRMVIYSGRRNPGTSTDGTSDTSPKVKLFLVCGEVPTEGFLIEVPPRLSSLRPQGVFLAVQYDTNNSDTFTRPIQKAWLWIGRCVPETNLLTARHVIETLKQSCPSELAAELRSVFEVQQTVDESVPGDLVFLLNAEDNFSAPLCLDVQPARGPFVIWQLTSSVEQRMAVRRLEYTLQPDSSLMSNSATRLQAFKDQSSSLSGANPFEMAKAVAERLRTSNDACNVPQRNADVYLTFPFLLRELYAVCQPALFLVLAGTEAVYLWQGWWPSSVHLKRQQLNSSFRHRSSTCSTTSQTSLVEEPSRLMDQPEGDGVVQSTEVVEPCITGSARSRFYTLRRAALQTAVSLATKVGSKAWVVYAGLEPPEFLSLFPPFIRTTEASAYFQREEGKVDGQQDLAESLLSSLKAPSYTLVELQQRPLPSDLDATCLEIYLSPEEFQAAFAMPREQFDQLPGWKKGQLRKQLGLF